MVAPTRKALRARPARAAEASKKSGTKRPVSFRAAATRLRKFALTLPESFEDDPWGDKVVKVDKKIFLFCEGNDARLIVAVKLPKSGFEALQLPFTFPTRYGLGKKGWVSSKITDASDIPFDLLRRWIAESYLAIAPKRLSRLLAG